MGLVENCWWNSPVDPINGIKIAKEMGFDSYDIFPLNTPVQTLRAQRKTFQELGIPCSSFIAAANGLTDFVPEARKFTVRYVKRQLEVGYDFDSPTMVLVLGNYSYEKREFKPELQWNWAVEGVREIADYSSSLEIEIALEYVPYMFYLLDSVDHIAKFIRDVDHPSVKANADVSHLFLMGDSPETVGKLRNKIINIHFSDCDGKVHGDLPPGRGVVPLKQYLSALKEIGVKCPVSIELQWPNDPNMIKEWVYEAYSQTAKMMDELGVRN
ncbi:MAG: sugar phosphate isomerase/epimerase [Thaumarchaeota archaeon]|nr:sugar phosphate isomerase/epimerase [Nitrososphaerota archaeon]